MYDSEYSAVVNADKKVMVNGKKMVSYEEVSTSLFELKSSLYLGISYEHLTILL
jgi:hypothetical protein